MKHRRYYLHRKLKWGGVKYNPYLRTVYWPHNQNCDNKYANALKTEFGYSIQLEII